ncbi:MAG TPA: zinc-ribbon domain-containing protein [Candidatus Binatia bacterium]|jgi:predicted Zn finger-like uncharacterized protein
MLVQCPSCHTTYRVSENLVTKSKPTFRCSRCKNVFVLGSKAGSGEPAAPRLQEESRELSFAFPPLEQSHEAAAESPDPPAAANGPTAAPIKSAPAVTIQQREPEWSLAPEPAVEETFTLKDEKSFAEIHHPIVESFDFASERPAVTKHEEASREGSAESSPSRPLSLTPYLLLCCGLLLLFSALTLLYKARPEPIESSLRAVPWIGGSVLKNDYLRQGIVLQAGRPRFQRILGNREVFMLSGVALNRNRVKVREVKIEAYVFGSDGKTIERQTITVGNAISSKIVRDLTTQEIATLQRQSPIRRFEILPDESAPFSIVFLKSSAQIKSFGYRVLSADESQ